MNRCGRPGKERPSPIAEMACEPSSASDRGEIPDEMPAAGGAGDARWRCRRAGGRRSLEVAAAAAAVVGGGFDQGGTGSASLHRHAAGTSQPPDAPPAQR